jgi:multiple antibiotic resistance protein
MSLSFASMTLILFFIMDAFGNASSFVKMLSAHTPAKRYWILLREHLFALGVMLLFNLFGEHFLNIFGLSEISVNLCSGLILFLFSIQVLFPSIVSIRQSYFRSEPFVIPIAVPFIAGPAVLATIMLFSHATSDSLTVTLSILVSWALSTLVGMSSFLLKRFVGENGLSAIEKLSAMILIMLAIQRFMEGIQLFMEKLS